MATKKISELASLSTATGDDLLIVVDASGPTTYKMNVSQWYANVQVDVVFNANVTARGTFTANAVVATGNVTFNTGNTFLTANNLVVKRSTTPASVTDVANSGTVGLIWTDGSYLYVQANSTHNKRVAVSTW